MKFSTFTTPQRFDFMFDLSLSIVSYNNKHTIEECLDSLYKTQSGNVSMQIIIINNSQTESCDDLEQKYPVKVIQMPKNEGFGKGHNAALPYIDSKYHAIVNPDIIFTNDIFDKLLQTLNDNPDIGCVAPLMFSEKGHIQSVYRRELTVLDFLVRYSCKCCKRPPFIKKRYNRHVMADVKKDQPFECDFIQGSFLVIPTSLLKRINGFDERYFMYVEDADICKRIRQTHKVVCVPECKVIHKWERASHTNLRLMKIHFASLVKYFNKWGWKLW